MGCLLLRNFLFVLFDRAIGIAASAAPTFLLVVAQCFSASARGRGRQLKSMTIRTLQMHASLNPSYTDEVTTEYLRNLDAPYFTEARFAELSEEFLALVGSRLCNGDEIINTLRGGCLLVGAESVPMVEECLPCIQQGELQ
jgi:hypothetical protein